MRKCFFRRACPAKRRRIRSINGMGVNRYLEDGDLSIDNNASERAMPARRDRSQELDVRRQQTGRPSSRDPDVDDRHLQSQPRGTLGLAERRADPTPARYSSGSCCQTPGSRHAPNTAGQSPNEENSNEKDVPTNRMLLTGRLHTCRIDLKCCFSWHVL